MQELNGINTLLGGHAITVKGVKGLIGNKRSIIICEIGCGGGDNLVAVARWCNKQGIKVNCIGIDIKGACIAVAKEQPLLKNISKWIVSDYATVQFDVAPDIIFSSLFCHHFTNDQLVHQLQWMRARSRVGFFINDLHRAWLAYYSIKILTRFFSRSYLVKNDAPVSVARGFFRQEWADLFRQAALPPPDIQWKWAFRYLVIYRNEQGQR
ncbi:MAG: hypothetical protein NVS3B15_00210 [Sediminibacterium sp.]